MSQYSGGSILRDKRQGFREFASVYTLVPVGHCARVRVNIFEALSAGATNAPRVACFNLGRLLSRLSSDSTVIFVPDSEESVTAYVTLRVIKGSHCRLASPLASR